MRGTGTFAADHGAGTITGNYLLAAAGVLVAVVAAALAQRWLGLSDLSLVFMLAVLVVAARTYTGPAVLAAVLCFLASNFFFIEPRYTFYIGARQGVATVGLFLAGALLAGFYKDPALVSSPEKFRYQGIEAAAQSGLPGPFMSLHDNKGSLIDLSLDVL